MRLLLLPLVMLITPVALSEDYVWKSKAEPIDYKCVVEREVGIDWDNGSQLVEFDSKGYKDIFLTHISNIPIPALPLQESPLSERRYAMEKYYFRNLLSKDAGVTYWKSTDISEEGSYFIRTEDSDPKSHFTYHFSQSCTYSDGASRDARIYCSDGVSTFSFHTGTKRFFQSALGNWHLDFNDQPSVLRYGTCREYFR